MQQHRGFPLPGLPLGGAAPLPAAPFQGAWTPPCARGSARRARSCRLFRSSPSRLLSYISGRIARQPALLSAIASLAPAFERLSVDPIDLATGLFTRDRSCRERC